MGRILRHEFGLNHCDVQSFKLRGDGFPTAFDADDYAEHLKLYKNIESISGHSVQPHSNLQDVYPEAKYYTFFREPLERCASHYNFQVDQLGKTDTFEQWIQDPRYSNRACRYMCGQEDANAAIQILKDKLFFAGLTKRLDETLVLLSSKIGGRKVDFRYPRYGDKKSIISKMLFDPGYGTAPDATIRKKLMMNKDQLALLKHYNSEDLILYEYMINEYYPKLVREYGTTLSKDVENFNSAPPRSYISAKWLAARAKRELVYKPFLKKRIMKAEERLDASKQETF